MDNKEEYEYVEHPSHYNHYYLEVIDILERIYGTECTAMWCEMTAMKYRLRMGTKPGEPIERDIEKERWYLNKRDELNKKLKDSECDNNEEDESFYNVQVDAPEYTEDTTETADFQYNMTDESK